MVRLEELSEVFIRKIVAAYVNIVGPEQPVKLNHYSRLLLLLTWKYMFVESKNLTFNFFVQTSLRLNHLVTKEENLFSIKSTLKIYIVFEGCGPSIKKLKKKKLEQNWTLQHDLIYTSEPIKDWLKSKKLKGSSQSQMCHRGLDQCQKLIDGIDFSQSGKH